LILSSQVILFVEDAQRSRDFYSCVLGLAPVLDVPGMTQFELGSGCLLGLMPRLGAERVLARSLKAAGAPRHELYLLVEQPESFLDRAVAAGASWVSAGADRNWGDWAGYVSDPDGHILAFARTRSDAQF